MTNPATAGKMPLSDRFVFQDFFSPTRMPVLFFLFTFLHFFFGPFRKMHGIVNRTVVKFTIWACLPIWRTQKISTFKFYHLSICKSSHLMCTSPTTPTLSKGVGVGVEEWTRVNFTFHNRSQHVIWSLDTDVLHHQRRTQTYIKSRTLFFESLLVKELTNSGYIIR